MPKITGKALFDAVAQDVKSFFPGRSDFEVKVEYDGMSPTCRGVGSNCRIRLPSEFQNHEISDPTELNFWLFTLGHEIAHYLNRHNEFNASTEESKLESKAIEDWADFFGAKLMMTLITYGPNTHQLYTSFPENTDYDTRYASMSKAFANLATTFYAGSSARYSTPMVRIGSGVAGVCSFIDRDVGSMNVWRSFGIMKRIYLSPHLKPLFETEPMKFSMSVDTIAGIHQDIQNMAPAITEGIDPRLERFIGTSYAVTPEERRRYVEAMREEALRQGVDVPPLLD